MATPEIQKPRLSHLATLGIARTLEHQRQQLREEIARAYRDATQWVPGADEVVYQWADEAIAHVDAGGANLIAHLAGVRAAAADLVRLGEAADRAAYEAFDEVRKQAVARFMEGLRASHGVDQADQAHEGEKP